MVKRANDLRSSWKYLQLMEQQQHNLNVNFSLTTISALAILVLANVQRRVRNVFTYFGDTAEEQGLAILQDTTRLF